MREMKLRAAGEGRKLRDVATEIFRRGLSLAEPQEVAARYRVKLPLIECGANPKELGGASAADALLKQEMEWSREAAGR